VKEITIKLIYSAKQTSNVTLNEKCCPSTVLCLDLLFHCNVFLGIYFEIFLVAYDSSCCIGSILF
jgi:hypothetical protein